MSGETARMSASPDAHAVDHARAEVLDKDVGTRGEALQGLLAALALQIDGDRALVAVVVEEGGGQPAGAVAAGAHVIAAARDLDLDHVGALVGKDHGREGSGDHRGQVDDANAVKGSCHDRRFLGWVVRVWAVAVLRPEWCRKTKYGIASGRLPCRPREAAV